MKRARGPVLATAIAALLFATGPTPGDLGGCGQSADELDAPRFLVLQARATCSGCGACGLTTKTCVAACKASGGVTAFPVGCHPLVHDGEVCLDRLGAGSCAEWTRWTADDGATLPTECEFCPP